MFLVPKPAGQFNLVNRQGTSVAKFSSIPEAVKSFLGWWGRHFIYYNYLGESRGAPVYRYDLDDRIKVLSHYDGPAHILINAADGEIVPLSVIIQALNIIRRNRYFEAAIIPGKPVPGVHKYNAGQHQYRRIRSHQLHQLSQIIDADEPPVRPKLKNRPTIWDEPQCFSRSNDNWKRYRNAQHR